MPKKKDIESYAHTDKERTNNPPVGLPDYDGRSLFPHQVFFPLTGPKDGWTRLARNLKAEIDESLIEAYRGTTSLPFEPGEHRRVAVKIVDDRGIESLEFVEVE